ncbi:uncharacterized protein N0V89_010351 [Didymosphaeria variabile]|uniref:F-box domain-containing protein n=1 Tax=Didymosphaeria variabile TaxID=1932322 RepID=A0A9W8XBZ8_9PLEO|nr:uncharacterized protein N0V89_010351 [Didymosphaeria variabile]KAJ4346422.1 hypothetical protein N0V89_010351 [Didymosphaeria variabile]
MSASPQLAATDRSKPNSLFYLPDELLVHVVSHLASDAQTLCALARTCRFFQIEAEKHIYTKIGLLSTDDLHAIIEAFTRRFDRVASVETLKILYRFHGGLGATADERSVFNACVGHMRALRSWEIESPYDNYKWDEGGDEWVLKDMENFRMHLEKASLKAVAGSMNEPGDVGLSRLESPVVIHTHGVSDDFWSLGDFHCLFRHPTLRHLHVSCLALPSDLPELEPYAKSTPLTELVFDECELEPKSLGRILATPKNLRHLTLGENVYNVNEGRSANPRLTRAPEAALAALKHVAHSLETLVHHDPAWRLNANYHKPVPIPGDGMRAFHSLKVLRVDTCSFLHRSIALSYTQAPPNLHTLQIRNPRPRVTRFAYSGAPTHEDFFEILPPYEPYTYLASLRTLDFVQGATQEMPIARANHIAEDEALRERHSIAYKLFKHGINLKVTLEATWRAGLIPPVLHGEPPPELVCMYDAEEIGFRRNWAAEFEAEQRAHDLEYAQTSAWLQGRPLPDDEYKGKSLTTTVPEEQRELPETDQLTDSDVRCWRGNVARSLNALWDRMRKADPDESDNDEPQAFTVMIESDDGVLWDDPFDDLDEDLDEDWMDAEEGDIEYVLAEELEGNGAQEDAMFWEAQAQALLAAAAAAADEDDFTENEVYEDLD